ncbi:Arc family DNA-binding protein [Methylobacterium sp. WL8]|nr:Arc family DNA-binding protein [Methylobacterium sp. WL8]
MARDDPQMKLRLPDDLRERIRDRAELNGRSMNTEILGALARSFPPSEDAIDLLGNLQELFRIHLRHPKPEHEAIFQELAQQLELEIRRLQKFDLR